MDLFLNMLVAGIFVGAIYGLVAVGYTVVFTATGVFNLAQGHLVMVAIMGTFYCTASRLLSLWVAWPLVVVGVVVLSLFEERTVVRPFLRRSGKLWLVHLNPRLQPGHRGGRAGAVWASPTHEDSQSVLRGRR